MPQPAQAGFARTDRHLGGGLGAGLWQAGGLRTPACKQVLDRRGLGYERQVDIPVRYRGVPVGTHTLDLLVERALVVELKSVTGLLDVHYAQLRAYLRAADVRVGLLINFGDYPLRIKRLVNKHGR